MLVFTILKGHFKSSVFCIAFFFQVFQVPLEKEGQVGGPILAPEEIKTIFGSIPDILDVHIKIKVVFQIYAT